MAMAAYGRACFAGKEWVRMIIEYETIRGACLKELSRFFLKNFKHP